MSRGVRVTVTLRLEWTDHMCDESGRKPKKNPPSLRRAAALASSIRAVVSRAKQACTVHLQLSGRFMSLGGGVVRPGRGRGRARARAMGQGQGQGQSAGQTHLHFPEAGDGVKHPFTFKHFVERTQIWVDDTEAGRERLPSA